ncbi:glycosyltransferase family 2 protein [Roseibacterium sp. SDUM158017]|uniref:glycosyltransferase family 2 protein n=1 Tax=Roseicyclus salinarum TaxID=3036773 RepID=UPI0024151F6D|nr:glycosyltransferase family 2 protein [Roseibacterium sp. SDUM158017]MDG4650159.1 glycosyltransferase family 2 protein [Roseibacterium sp. SDUM158017]
MDDARAVPRVDVSIVMPCLNEAATVADCVADAREALAALEERRGLRGEVIIADNGSSDGSQALAAAAGARVIDVDEKGYGAALRGGFRAAHGRFLVMGDSDRSYDFREAVPMVEALMDGAELCMGSRFDGEIKPGAMPWKNRYIGNPALSGILRLLFRTPVRDSHCGLRAIRRSTYDRLRLSSDGMEFASEMVLKAALQRVRIDQVPCTLSPDGRGRPPHLSPWRDGLRHLFYMFMLSPSWLFFAPAALLLMFGTAIFAVLLVNPDATMVRVGRLGSIGDHWAIMASASVVLSTQTFIAGYAAMLLGYRSGYLPVSGRARRVLSFSSLGTWLLGGGALVAMGAVWAFAIVGGWIASGFGALDQIRGLVAASTLVVTGCQVCFGGFFMSIVAGNRLSHSDVLTVARHDRSPAGSRAAQWTGAEGRVLRDPSA